MFALKNRGLGDILDKAVLGLGGTGVNETIQSMLRRRSMRCYKDEMIPQETLEQILQAGTYAATGMNRQSPIIVAVTDRRTRDRLSRLNAGVMGQSGDPFYGAPVVLVVLARRDVPTHVYDGSLVMGNLMLAAHTLGVGSCWIHRAKEVFDSSEGRALLKEWGVEGDYEGIGHCILGYAGQPDPSARPRKEDYIYYVR